jgi:4-carboxymuconolactone decarboxylase
MPPESPGTSDDALLRLSAALGTRDRARIRAAMEGVGEAARPEAVEEVILQAHLFIGFPDALNALSLWREVSGHPPPPPLDDDPGGWEARGERVCARVYGGSYRRLRENVRALHPDVDGWMVAGGYGRVIGRPGLDLATRELCIATLLAVWRVPRQLHSHLRGALNAGASVARVDAAVDAACACLDAAGAAEARRLWGDIRARAG